MGGFVDWVTDTYNEIADKSSEIAREVSDSLDFGIFGDPAGNQGRVERNPDRDFEGLDPSAPLDPNGQAIALKYALYGMGGAVAIYLVYKALK